MAASKNGKSGFKGQFDKLMRLVNQGSHTKVSGSDGIPKFIFPTRKLSSDAKILLDDVLYNIGMSVIKYVKERLKNANIKLGSATSKYASILSLGSAFIEEYDLREYDLKKITENADWKPIFSIENAIKVYKLKGIDAKYFTNMMQNVSENFLILASRMATIDPVNGVVDVEDLKTKISASKFAKALGSEKIEPKTKKEGYEGMSVKELKEKAKGKVPGYYKLNKADLIDALKDLDEGSGSSGRSRSKSPPRQKPTSPKSPKTSKKLTKTQIKKIKNHELKVTELKDLLRKRSLPLSGKKADLEARLLSSQ
jgi:hypothetical protein